MKKALGAVLIVIIASAAVIFCGCGGNEKNKAIAGEWIPTTATINGETVNFSDLNTEADKFGFVFETNGNCEITIAGTKNNGKYTFNDTSVDIDYGGKTERLLYSDGMLTLNFNYNNETTSFMFTKKTD